MAGALFFVSNEVANLKYLVKMIRKSCKDEIREISCHGVKEVIKDVYGGIGYERREHSVGERDHESGGGS